MALVSNMFLLLNMARRVKFTIAQPVTIIGWYMPPSPPPAWPPLTVSQVHIILWADSPLRHGLGAA